LQVNGSRALRVERFSPATSPSLLGGYAGNGVGFGFDGQTVAGGGGPGSNCWEPEDATFTRSCANFALNPHATVGGGQANVARHGHATVAGGSSNTARAYATVGGGFNNRAIGGPNGGSTVAGGGENLASGNIAVVAGGFVNSAMYEYAAVGGGAGNVANAAYSTVPGGFGNHASGDYSVAMGRNAIVNAHGSIVFADGTAGTFTSGVANEFIAGFSGGIGFYTQKGFGTYCRMGAGAGTWSCSSSRDVKLDFADVDPRDILERVAALPVTSWRFKGEPVSVRHVGPTAQDFRAAFSLGSDDESIAQVDVSGVALAAIQGLNAKLEAKLAEQARERAELRRTVELLLARRRVETAYADRR
jgi:hypothetical protein